MTKIKYGIRFQILCEDSNHYYFCKSFLESTLGKGNASCRRVDVPLGRGSGEQKVREKFPSQLQAIRSRRAAEHNWLVVVIDADNKSIEDRKEQLPIEKSDKVLRIIPKRNIETWFEWLDTGEADEEKNYKIQYMKAKPTLYGKKLAEIVKNKQCDNVGPSILNACGEWDDFIRANS